MKLTPETVAHLRRPFMPAAIKFRVDQKRPADRIRCLPYIDSSLARERLNDVDPAWFAEYEWLLRGFAGGDPLGVGSYVPVGCTLSVLGVGRYGVGQAPRAKADGSLFKSAQSDALKRAALEFGVGAYLRALPTAFVSRDGVWTKKDRQGQEAVGGLTHKGVRELQDAHTRIIQQPGFVERWGQPIDYGDVEDAHRSATEAEPDEPQQTLMPTVASRKGLA